MIPNNERRNLQRSSWVHILLAIYCRFCSLPLRRLASEIPLEKMKFSLAIAYQLEIPLGLGLCAYVHISFQF